MNLASRRTLVRAATGGAAVFAISRAQRLWAQDAPGGRTVKSTLTGSVIELVEDEWEFSPGFGGQEAGDDYLRELYIMNNETSVFEVEFVQTELTSDEYMSLVLNRISPDTENMEIAGSGVTDNGLWFASTFASQSEQVSIYCEYQAGAYEGTDLMVTLRSQPEAFAQNVPSVQEGILIGDLAPFMMVEASDVLSLEFPVLAVATATEASGRTGRTSRTSRTSRSSSGNREETPTRTNRRQQTGSATSDDGFVGTVRAHQQQYQTSISEFALAVSVFGDEAATDAELAEAFATIDGLADGWIAYPAEASQLSVPPEFADLGALYFDWADAIGALGQAWFDFVSEVGTVDDLFDQIEVVDHLNSQLIAELDSLQARDFRFLRQLQPSGSCTVPVTGTIYAI